MEWKIGNVTIPNQVCLAPMAGITSTTFRSICKSQGAGLVVGEMVSDKALIYKSKKTFDLLKMSEMERPFSQQIFGSNAETLAEAAKIVTEYLKPDIIDINMGCPVPKIAIKSKAGSSLMKDPELVREIVTAVVKVTDIPVTVKMRAGWDEEHKNAPLIAKICEEAGAKAIFIHGRTRSAGYKGNVDLDIIKEVVKSVKIPVIGNGDIKDISSAKKMLEYTGCTAIMIGRGALGNPWLIKDIKDYLENGEVPKEVSNKERLEMMRYNITKLIEEKGEKIAILQLRTELMYYLKYLPKSKEIKLKIIEAQSAKELLDILDNYEKEII